MNTPTVVVFFYGPLDGCVRTFQTCPLPVLRLPALGMSGSGLYVRSNLNDDTQPWRYDYQPT